MNQLQDTMTAASPAAVLKHPVSSDVCLLLTAPLMPSYCCVRPTICFLLSASSCLSLSTCILISDSSTCLLLPSSCCLRPTVCFLHACFLGPASQYLLPASIFLPSPVSSLLPASVHHLLCTRKISPILVLLHNELKNKIRFP